MHAVGTKFMLSKSDILNLEVNATKLNQVKCFKYLEVNVDCELNWNIHFYRAIEQKNWENDWLLEEIEISYY